MFIIIDKKIPEIAKQKLSCYGSLIELETNGITESSISGHPDIFFCNINGHLITPPNLPKTYSDLLKKNGVEIVTGNNPVNEKYPGSAIYNAVVSGELLIHRLDITDPIIIKHTAGYKKINVRQGFSRCSLLPLKDNSFITSDRGIHKVLTSCGLRTLYVNPEKILLPGHSYGFFGGAAGVYRDQVFFIGSLEQTTSGPEIKKFLTSLRYNIVELYNGPLFDGGSIIFT